MNKNVKLWIDALRSGKYKQGDGALCRADKYCCLGVACEVAIDQGIKITKTFHGFETYYDGQDAVLPPSVKDFFGLDSFSGLIRDSVSLIFKNDVDKLTFNQIADLIESNPPGLFKEETNETPN